MLKSKKLLKKQRELLDERIAKEVSRHRLPMPKKGWLKVIRECLGLPSTLLGKRMGLSPTHIHKLEEREKLGTASLSSLAKAADAMGCEIVYNIVPKNGSTLDKLLEDKCLKYAKNNFEAVQHSMDLEAQGLTEKQKEKQIEELVKELKDSLSSKIWEK